MPTEEDARSSDLWIPSDQIVADRQMVAEFCAAEIRRESRRIVSKTYQNRECEDADSDKPLNALELFRASVGLTLQIVEKVKEAEDSRDVDACYVADDGAAQMVPLISMAPRLSKEKRRAIMSHEMTHHIQRTRVAPTIYGAETVISPALDGESIRQDIAQRVEEMLLRRRVKMEQE